MNSRDADQAMRTNASGSASRSTILVTGATGLIGRSVCASLVRAGYSVFAATSASESHVEPGCDAIRVDIREAEAVMEAVARSHLVIHLAGVVGNAACERDIETTVGVNVSGTLNVLEAATAFDRPVIFASVGNVADDNPYAISKATAERFCLMFNRERGAKVMPLRIFNVYGPGQSRETGKLIARNVAMALAGQDLVCHGDGMQVEDFISVRDVSDAIVSAVRSMLASPMAYEPIDLGTGVGHTILEVLELVRQSVGGNSRIVKTGARVGASTRRLVARDGRLLEGRPTLPLADGISAMVASARTSLREASGVTATGAGSVMSSPAAPPAAPQHVSVDGLTSGRVLVTGGNGFIGIHVVQRLIARGFDVTVLDRMGSRRANGADFILGDIRDGATLDALAPRFDGIVNLAAILGTSETVRHPHGTVASNMVGALHVFEAARRHGCRVAQITVGNHWMNNPYAITKSAAERLATFYNQRYGTKIAVVRGLNAYGEWQKAWPVRKIIPNFVLPALRGQDLTLYGDGEQRMDMIYVGDLAEILVRSLVMEHDAWTSIFEAGTGDAPTVNEIAACVLRAVPGTGARVVHVPMRQGEVERSVVIGDPATLAPLRIDKRDLLPLGEGLARTVRFYAEHAELFR